MKRLNSVLVLPVLMVGLLASAGCDDPKQRIALLEDENQRLLDEVNGARLEADNIRGDLDFCEQELASARADNGNLRSQLAALRDRPQPKPEPLVPEGWTAVPGGAMIAIEGEVLFQSGKAVLRPEARKTLDAVARTVTSTYGTQDVLVYGHTDDVPIKKSGWKDNLELSAQRALAVVRYLQDRGVGPDRLVAAGCGEHRPVAPNSSAGNRSRNRRVEVYALDVTVQTAGR